MKTLTAPAPTSPVTHATSHLLFAVRDDLGPCTAHVTVETGPHSREMAESYGGDDLGSFDVSSRLVAPGNYMCETVAAF